MKLHEDAEIFRELVEATAQSMALPQVYIEKDYWVTNALKNLSLSPHAAQAVFKGGTSLSKAHKLIHRFSEDIDLAVMAEGLGSSRSKKLLTDVEAATNAGLESIDDDIRVSKGSSYRRTVYRYPREADGEDFGQASPELLIEVNAFTRPEPHESLPMQTLIAEELLRMGRDELIAQFALEPFSLNVLSIRRTLTEKILGIVKDSYYDDPVAQLGLRIRHLYDICQILKIDAHKAFIQSEDFKTLCAACIEDEKQGFFKYAECLEKPLADAPLFSKFSEWAPAIQKIYEGDFADLVYGDLPLMAEIEQAIAFIKTHA
ncbi:MAG: nucleotidyl transferase AbiEii/AbiGii toxin family protein [Micavibrio aeruginosavorus]|uniref:Nucleotidyl transferase AbiEii/AbiGii toxin family protein n=1 Tax=Micavibrio aeruginosavorus TaxID=349221 RepID=A0A7T5R0A9_9BACT|nr:MAG: nucleotidyl transferase AbiEii/AbiGii toxin family protein [Micavibrio aeruginosavorus]